MALLQDVTHQIIELDKTRASIKVLYKTPAFDEGLIYDLDIPIENGMAVTGQALTEYIKQNTPLVQLTESEQNFAWLEDRKAKAAKVDLSSIVVTPRPVSLKEAAASQPITTGTRTL